MQKSRGNHFFRLHLPPSGLKILALPQEKIPQYYCDSQCDAQDYITWEPVRNESAYDRDPSSLNQPDGRPLGFQSDTIDYINDAGANARRPCVTITGCTNSQYLEIMVEPEQQSSICTQSDVANSEAICGDGQITSCVPCPSEEVTYQFFCRESCDQFAVSFWFRFVISDPDTPDPEVWCRDRNTDEFPTSLYNNNPIPVTRGQTTPKSGRGTSLRATLTLILCALITVTIIAKQ
ncbi:uncharacterized protein LOC129255486 isoform X1 [Lytechinus pictus]|uniref:uncharacterized protein LOC129255486 isoform X1 n=1 Tax=Lytechinus pictus TaxID=7653 RepID=UPI0030B9E47C